MANRFPLIIDTDDGNKLKELQNGDNLNLQGSNIVNLAALSVGGNITSTGTIDAQALTINGEALSATQVQSNWTESDTDSAAFILNKPFIATDIDDLTDNNNRIPQTLLDLEIDDGNNGQVLTTNGDGGFFFSTVTGGGGGSGDLSAADISVTTLTATGGGSLTWDSVATNFNFRPADLSAYATTASISDVIRSGDSLTLLDNTTSDFTTKANVLNSIGAGTNITVTNNGDGTITIASTAAGGTQNLQDVTDEGATTTNNITAAYFVANNGESQFQNMTGSQLKLSNLTAGSVAIVAGDGLLNTDTELTYNASTNALTLGGDMSVQTITASGTITAAGFTNSGAGVPTFTSNTDFIYNTGSSGRFKIRNGPLNIAQFTTTPSTQEVGDIIWNQAYSTIGIYSDDIDGSGTAGYLYFPNVAAKYPLQLPNMSNTERNAVTAVPGMMLFNTDTGDVNVHDGSAWRSISI
jgi:hypothetical protein